MQTLTYKYRYISRTVTMRGGCRNGSGRQHGYITMPLPCISVIIAYIINLFQCTGCNPIFSN